MCLIISKYIHPKSGPYGKVNCLVAQEDIVVYKCLDCVDGEYCTTYREMPITFNKGKYVYKEVDMSEHFYCGKIGSASVDVGIHSFGTKGAALATCKEFHVQCGTSMHYAVIPKGSNFYIGIDEDVVSNNLIVYREKRTFDKYYKGTIDITEYMFKYLKQK